MTSRADVVIIHCYVINTQRNTHMPHHEPVSSELFGDIVIQDSRKHFIEETDGMQ